MRGTISREHPWEVMPDLYFYRDPEEVRDVSEMPCLPGAPAPYLCLLLETGFASIITSHLKVMVGSLWCLLSGP